MSVKQEQIEVLDGVRPPYIVPKSAEAWVRQRYNGKPEEKRLIIRPYPNKITKTDRAKIVKDVSKKLTPRKTKQTK